MTDLELEEHILILNSRFCFEQTELLKAGNCMVATSTYWYNRAEHTKTEIRATRNELNKRDTINFS